MRDRISMGIVESSKDLKIGLIGVHNFFEIESMEKNNFVQNPNSKQLIFCSMLHIKIVLLKEETGELG